jgi:hypothetical protein
MARVLCEVTEGLRESEATVQVKDAEGRPEFLPVERAFLTFEGDTPYLPVSVVAVDYRRKVALIALPVEADSGANRVWVKLAHIRDLSEAPA